MRRLILVLLLLCAPVFARQRIFGFCEAGNATVTIGGLTSSTTYQASYPSATVSVFATGTTNLVSIYSDNLSPGTVKSNPFTMTPGDGYWFAYADNGRYDVKCSGTGISAAFTRGDFLVNDPAIGLVVTPVAFSATPTIAAVSGSVYTMTLTGNVTSSTITGSMAGQIIYFQLCQDGTGGRTFAWPASFLRPPTISAIASACTNATFFFDGVNWRQLSATGDALVAPSGGTLNGTFAGNPTFSGSPTFSGAVTNNSTVANNGAVTNGSTTTLNGALTNNSTSTLNGVVTATSGLSANGEVTPQVYGAKADVVKLTDGAITSGTANFTSASASFTANDVGKAIVVHGAGVAGADLVTTIVAFVSATAATLTATAGTTSSAALTYYGTDDTAAIKSCVANGTAVGKRCTLSNGSTYMSSNSTNTVTMSGTGIGGILDGSGTVVYAPTGALVGGVNDRFLYIKSTESGSIIQVAAGAIAKAATSFTANAAGDVSSWVKGDWIVLCEHDAGFGDCLYVDWVQVSSIAGATVNIITPFRMAFPNARTWNVSGAPANCTASAPCGLSARKITNITNATLRDFHLIVPKIAGSVSGIVTRETRGVLIDNLTIDNASSNSLATYLDQGLRLNNLRINNAVGSEIAGTVDFSISGLQSQLVGTALNGFIVPVATCVTVDIGSGFGTLSNSVCGPNSNTGVFLNGGIHDTTVTSNTVGWIKGTSPGAAIDCIACYRVVASGNVLEGGDGSSIGLAFLDSSAYTVAVNSDQNVAAGNIVNGFPTNYSCAGSLGTDNCEDYNATGVGQRTIRNAQMVGLTIGEAGNSLVNGANNNLVPVGANGASVNWMYISGPTGAFSISGFAAAKDGTPLLVYNSTAFAMTISNEGGGSSAANRIKTLTGGDVTLRAGTSFATFIYSVTSSRWLLVATN